MVRIDRNLNRGYMKLVVWQKAKALLKPLSEALQQQSIPYKLTNQVLDSTQSISANIAEGYCRRHLNEYIQYCYIALGSAGETTTRIAGLHEMGYLTAGDTQQLLENLHKVEIALLGLVRALERKRGAGDWTDHIAEEPLEYLLEHQNLEDDQ